MPGMPWKNRECENYIRCLHILDAARDELRNFFIQEWDRLYQASLGPWDDTNVIGQELFNMAQSRPRPHMTDILTKFRDGNTNKWDFSVLIAAILYSNSIGASLNPTQKTEIDNLRKIRNEITHQPEKKLSDADFQTKTTNVENALNALGLSSSEVVRMRDLFASFRDLPPAPTHEVVYRSDKIHEIKQDLEKLRSDNDGKLTYFYMSGNPGCGKSQLARQVCESISDDVDWLQKAMFVITLDGKDLDSLYKSCEKFCRRLNCEESKLQRVLESSKQIEKKIEDLRTEISRRIEDWKKWWIIVDNVENLMLISQLLPRMGKEVWNNGQIIITTQNSYCVPPDGVSTKHISISLGMKDQECCQLLALITKTVNDRILDEVGKKLDRQPLVMASAAVYMSKIIENPSNCSWEGFLEKLEKGGREKAEEELKRINFAAYPSTMTEAVRSTISAENGTILQYAFNLFAFISFERLPFDLVVKYIQEQHKELDDYDILLAIKHCSLFVYVGNEERDIRLHRVIHETIREFCRSKECERGSSFDEEILKVLKTLYYYFKDREDKTKLIPHLKAFSIEINSQSRNHGLKSADFNAADISEMYLFCAETLNENVELSSELQVSTEFIQLSLKTRLEQPSCNDQGNDSFANIPERERHYCNRVLKILQPSGINHNGNATCYNYLGRVYSCKIGDLERAIDYHKQALEIQLQQLGPNHIDVAFSYGNLGNLCRDNGDLENASGYYQQALEIQLKLFGENHVDVAHSYHNLATVCSKKGDSKQACGYYERALEILFSEISIEK